MGLREFDDANGKRWRVWDTVPARTEGLGNEFRAGWLTFDNGLERRRLAPVPQGWAIMPPDRLLLLLRVAHPAMTHDLDLKESGIERRAGERRQAERRHGDRRRTHPPPP
jgi:hypothetical protein